MVSESIAQAYEAASTGCCRSFPSPAVVRQLPAALTAAGLPRNSQRCCPQGSRRWNLERQCNDGEICGQHTAQHGMASQNLLLPDLHEIHSAMLHGEWKSYSAHEWSAYSLGQTAYA